MKFLTRVVKNFLEHDLFTYANSLTYQLLFAFFPFILFFVCLMGYLHIDTAPFLVTLEGVLPEQVASVIVKVLEDTAAFRNAGLLSVGLAIAFFSAASGFRAVIKGLNRAYDEKETRKFWVVWPLAFLLVLALAFSLLLSLLLNVFGPPVYKWIVNGMGISQEHWAARLLFGFAGAVLAAVCVLFTVVLIYRFASVRKIPLRATLPGAVTTVLAWTAATWGLNVYVSHFNDFSPVYGSLAGVILLLLWLNIVSIVLLVGGEINAVLLSKAKSAQKKEKK